MTISNTLSVGAKAAAISVAVATTTSVYAQDVESASTDKTTKDDGADTVQEVVVTATRRTTSTKDTPAAITAVSGVSIDQAKAYSLENFTRLDPSIQIDNRGIGDNQLIIRGIESAGGPTVGLYYDETVLTGLGLDGGSDAQPNIQMHDIQRVEILKGPQGTIFGASSMSGTIRIITNKPDLESFGSGFSLAASSVKGGSPLNQFDGMVNLPIITDKLGARAVVWGDEGGGYIDQIRNGNTNKNVNDHGIWGGRLSVKAQPTDRLDVLLTYTHQKSDSDGSQYFTYEEGAYDNTSPTQEPYNDNVDIGSIIADYHMNAGTLTLTSSYMNRKFFDSRDSTPTAERFGMDVGLAYHERQDLSNWSNEIRFASSFAGPFQLVAGAYYAEQRVDDETAALVADDDSGLAPCDFHEDCVDAGYATSDINSGSGSTDTDQYALFAEGNYALTQQLQATVGVRYYNADISDYSVSKQSLRFPTSPVQSADEVTLDSSFSEDKVSYNFALAYTLNPDSTIYARAASGFRPGGVNDAATAAQQGITVPDGYKADTLWNYEVGSKTYFFNRAAYAELAVYRIDWSKQQISVTDPGGTYVFISNAGKTYVNGVELNLNARPLRGLSINLGGTYTDSKLAEDLPSTSETVGYDGDRLPYTPKWSLAGQVEYEHPLAGRVSGYIGTNFNYRGSSYTDFNDENDNYEKLKAYTLVNATTGVRFDGWDLSLFVDNLTDQAPELGLRVTGDGYRVFTARPLTAGVRVSAQF